MNIIVLSGYGLNCEEETAFAFIEAGVKLKRDVKVKTVHINEIINNPKQLKSYNVLAIPGGFSYGDNTGAGNALALRILNNLWHEVQEFLLHDKLIIGICNGCQVLTRLIPDFANIALTYNDVGYYQCRWVKVKTNPKGNSVWLKGLDELYIPVAHGEGKFCMEQDTLNQLLNNNSIALRYVKYNNILLSKTRYERQGHGKQECIDEDLSTYVTQQLSTEVEFPYNPNGSVYDTAAVSDKSGRVLALMPHPERAIFFTQQENWPLVKENYHRSNTPLPKYGDGMLIFENAIRYFHH